MANDASLERFITASKTAGVPRDQLENFLRASYVPLPWQLKFHAVARECDVPGGPVNIGVGGARGPGKSHGVFSQVTLDDCQRVKGLKCLFLRQTGASAKESFGDLVSRVLTGKVKYEYASSTNKLVINGSTVLMGGFRDERDIDKYVGIEYDIIAVEELNQLRRDRIEKLRGSLRTSKPGWRPRMYSSFNPGGKGHLDVKDEYIMPFREHREVKTRFIPSTYKDNPYLNVEYIEYLESLSGDLGRMWREGDWDIFAGQFFDEWRNEQHVIKPYPIPSTFRRFRSIDPSGRHGITSCGWYAMDFDRNIVCYKEYYMTGRDADEHAKNIAKMSIVDGVEEKYDYTVIDSAAFSKLGLPESIAEVYQRNGVTGLVPASKDRVAGWDFMHQYLRWGVGVPPRLRVFSTCVDAIRTIPSLIRLENNPLDLDSDGDDHFADQCRYLLQTLRDSATPKPKSIVEKRLDELRQKDKLDFNYNF